MKLRLPSPSMVVALIALVVACAGTATAAVVISSSSQIKANAVRASDIRNELTGADIKNESLSTNDIKDGTIAARDIKKGAITSDQLASAVKSQLGGGKSTIGFNATEVVRKSGPDNQAPGQHKVLTMTQLPPGTYLLLAKTTISPIAQSQGLGEVLNPDKTSSAQCVLEAGGDQDNARTPIASPGTFTPATLNNQMTRSIDAPVDVTLTCDVTNLNWKATDSSIVALKLEGSTRTDATG